MPKPRVRKGMPSVQLTKEEFAKRARERFYDPTFASVASEIDRIIELAVEKLFRIPPKPAQATRGHRV